MVNSLRIGERFCAYTCLVVLVLLVSAGLALGQAETASIAGTATDPSGGAVAGAKVEATNVGTNAVQNTVTDSAGRYKVADLPVGTYNVQASTAGFKTVVHSGIVLAVGGSVVVDFALPIGQVSQTVNVESEVSRVETTTSEVSTLISPEQMRDLPLNGRNFEQLLTLAPGVSTVAAALNAVTGRLYGMQNNYSVSGSRPTGQMFLLDDTDIRDFWEHGTGSGYAATSLGVEAIGEFQVLTNTYTAEFAGNGAVVNATSRAGTNDLHGGAYEFFRNNVLDARDIVDPTSGPPPFRRNQFGGDLGGPIKKNKLFFFGNYESLRQSLATTTDLFLPEPYTVQGMLPCSLITPTPGTCTPSTSANSTQAGISLGAVPSANPISEQIAALYSLCKGCHPITPNIGNVNTNLPGNCVTIGCDLGGYYEASTAPPLTINENYYMGRVDYTLGANDSVFVRYTFDNANVGDPRDPYEIFPETDHSRNQFLTVTERHVASATLVNSIHFGYVRNNENSSAQPALTAAQMSKASAFSTGLGGPAITTDPLRFVPNEPGELPRQDGQNGGFEQIIFPLGPDPNRPDEIVQNKFSGGDDVTWTHGAHSIKFGVVVTRVQTQNLQTAYSNGGFFLSYAAFPVFGRTNYDGQYWIQGSPLEAFAVPTIPPLNNATRYFREIMVAPYIQDDWKVTSRLTLNLGFRYDGDTNPIGWALGNQPMTTLIGSFLPPVGPVAPPAGLPVFTPVKHVFAHNINALNFEPRFGFAFDPFRDHKTSIRGGVGIFDDPTSGRLWESNFINTAPSGSSFLFFPSFPSLCATGCNPPGATSEFAGVTYQPDGVSPYQITYNLDVQREVWHGTILSVGYVGSVSRHLWTQGDINPPMCTTFPDCTALPITPTSRPTSSTGGMTFIPGSANACMGPDQNDLTAPGGAGTGCYGSGVQFPIPIGGAQTGPRINGAFGSLIQAYNTGASAYNSLQVALNHQFARNFVGQFNYTWSRCVDDGSFASSLEEFAQLVVDRYNESYAYGNCTFDIRHNISANVLYSLPFKGNRLVEGWQISSIVGIHTGLPLNVYNNSLTATDPAFLGTQWGSQANYTFAPGCTPNHLLKQRINQTTIQWFDPACYEETAPGFLGDVKRDSLPGPGTFSADISIVKNTKITERLNAQFRAECFNCVNHFNVGGTGAGVLGEINAPGGVTGQTTFSQSPVVTPRQIQFALKFDF
ncbi:MAG TPA: carboxypeptidase-like regulatory domain-containing protein [Candidatus Acidoferrales bacterium]|nr:carboxypeptidase-like regulatory domain-containing protein [Candidatus Acidoferrales bacterium]